MKWLERHLSLFDELKEFDWIWWCVSNFFLLLTTQQEQQNSLQQLKKISRKEESRNICIFSFLLKDFAAIVCCWVAVISKTSGFWPRVRARALRAPVFLGSLLRPSQLRCFLFTPQNLSSGPNSGHQGRLSFHWSKLHPTELLVHCILLSYAAPSWAPLHPNELRCTLMSYTVPY